MYWFCRMVEGVKMGVNYPLNEHLVKQTVNYIEIHRNICVHIALCHSQLLIKFFYKLIFMFSLNMNIITNLNVTK